MKMTLTDGITKVDLSKPFLMAKISTFGKIYLFECEYLEEYCDYCIRLNVSGTHFKDQRSKTHINLYLDDISKGVMTIDQRAFKSDKAIFISQMGASTKDKGKFEYDSYLSSVHLKARVKSFLNGEIDKKLSIFDELK